MATQQVYQQSEVVRKKAFPVWQKMDWGVWSSQVKKGEVERIGERAYRIPVVTDEGGALGTYNPRGGDMGRGTMSEGTFMTASFFPLRLNYEIDTLSIKATTNTGQHNPFKRAIKNAPGRLKLFWDMLAHSDGTAVIGTATATATVSGATQYTLDTVNGVSKMLRGQYVVIVNAAKTAILGRGRIAKLDSSARTILLSGLIASPNATDLICIDGILSPSATGVTGLYAWNSSATSGTLGGLDRAVENEIIANSLNGGGIYTHEMTTVLFHRGLKRRGKMIEWLGLCPVSQKDAIMRNVMSIQNIDLAGTAAQAIDRLPSLKNAPGAFMIGGIPHRLDIHQAEDRMDYVVVSNFGRAQLSEMDFYETAGKSGPDARFFNLVGGSGAPANSVWFGLTCDEDLYCVDPGANGFIHSLALPPLNIYS